MNHSFEIRISKNNKEVDFCIRIKGILEEKAYRNIAAQKAMKKHLETYYFDEGDELKILEVKEIIKK